MSSPSAKYGGHERAPLVVSRIRPTDDNERTEGWVLGDTDEAAPARVRPQIPAREPSERRTTRRHAGAPTLRRRGVRTLQRSLVFTLWLALFALGLFGEVLFVGGVLRDGEFGDASVAVDLSAHSDWRPATFRPLMPGRYTIYLVSDDREPRVDEAAFAGRLSVRVADSAGRALLTERVEPPSLDHRLHGGVEWTRLAELRVARPSVDLWTVSVRVAREDERFTGVSSRVAIVRDKGIAGIAGLLNYAVVAPTAVLLALSLAAGIVLPRRGGTWMPALLSAVALSGLAFAYTAA